MSPVLARRVALPVSAEVAFGWHQRPGVLERLSPPWRGVSLAQQTGGVGDGTRVTLDLGPPVGRWTLERSSHEPGRVIRERQVSGPFARCEHTLTFVPDGDRCWLEDRIDYEPRLPFGRLFERTIDARLAQLVAWRQRVTRLDLERLAARGGRPITVAVTGASGMIGRELVAFLSSQACVVRRLVRRAPREASEIAWDPARGVLDHAALVDIDAVVHLAGAGVAEARWTAARKRELVESRVLSTELLARTLANMPRRPTTWVSASAIGWYGDRGEEALDESSGPGRGFLAELAKQWEAAAEPARRAGVRVVHPRIGIVLWPRGGALSELIAPTRIGAGGPLGNGQQWWSWVTLHDVLDMVLHALDQPAVSGAFNAVAPEPARQRDVASALGRSLGRPALVPAPAFALRAMLGRELADTVLLGSQRVTPCALMGSGFAHRDPQLQPALDAMLGRTAGV